MLKSKVGCLMQEENTSPEYSMTCSRGRTYAFFKVPHILLNKMVKVSVVTITVDITFHANSG